MEGHEGSRVNRLAAGAGKETDGYPWPTFSLGLTVAAGSSLLSSPFIPFLPCGQGHEGRIRERAR